MKRPQTPHIEVSSSNQNQNEKEQILKNFSNFMKQVIDNQNETFLTGEKNIVKYLLAKYLQVPYEELDTMKKISIRINNDYGLLNQFGQFLPELIILKLNFSNIMTMNNLGTSFTSLMCLQMNNCFLTDLSGIICLQNLRVLDLKNNEISDLIELEMTNLQKINLNSNLISEFDNLTFLSGMDDLDWLNLDNNPISKKDNYKEQLQKYLPNVSDIDLDEDIVSMFDNGHIKIKERKIEERGFIHTQKMTDKKLVNEINKVLGDDEEEVEGDSLKDENNDKGKEEEVKIEEDDQSHNSKTEEESSSPVSINITRKQHDHKLLTAIMSQSQSQFPNKGIEHDIEEEKNITLFQNNNTQKSKSNVFRTQTTKYQIDASGGCHCNHSKSKYTEHEKDNYNNNLNTITHGIKPQIKRGSSLNPIRGSRIEREKITITAKPLLQSIISNNTNPNNMNILKESTKISQIAPIRGNKNKLFLNKK